METGIKLEGYDHAKEIENMRTAMWVGGSDYTDYLKHLRGGEKKHGAQNRNNPVSK